MSLNDIKLSGPLLTEMYGKYLIDNSQSEQKEMPKKVMVVLHETAQNSGDNQQLLTSILSACNLSTDEIELIDLNKVEKEINLEQMLENAPGKLIFFGLMPGKREWDASSYFKEFTITGKIVLQAPALSEIAEDKQLKMKLWSCLRIFFNLDKA
jgi:DNA polymerase III psi subunit